MDDGGDADRVIAVQVAKALGASVVGICSGPNAEFVKRIGAVRPGRVEGSLG